MLNFRDMSGGKLLGVIFLGVFLAIVAACGVGSLYLKLYGASVDRENNQASPAHR
jgi:hypothetical protein